MFPKNFKGFSSRLDRIDRPDLPPYLIQQLSSECGRRRRPAPAGALSSSATQRSAINLDVRCQLGTAYDSLRYGIALNGRKNQRYETIETGRESGPWVWTEAVEGGTGAGARS